MQNNVEKRIKNIEIDMNVSYTVINTFWGGWIDV